MDEPRPNLLKDYSPTPSSGRSFDLPKGEADAPRRYPDPGQVRGTQHSMRPSGTGGGGSVGGAFYTMRTVVSGGADNGDIMLQGGTGGGIIVAEFLLYDASATSWAGTPGQHLQLKMTGDGSATSGILDPAFTVTAAAITVVTTMGTDTYPEAASLTGKFAHVSLGSFYSGGFNPADVGNVPCAFCWQGYNTNR